MKIKIYITLLLFVIGGCLLIAAAKNNYLKSYQPTPLTFEIPEGWPKPTKNIFENNPLTQEGFDLGKKIFYDSRLSSDGEVSCGSCHQQFAAFASFDHDLSHGVGSQLTTRNAPALFNLAWMKEYHWDGGSNHIETQALAPITAANEMNETIENVLKKIKADTSYQRFFYNAFGSTGINSQRMLKALAQFTGSLVSANSKYDKVKRGEALFTAAEENGYQIFKSNCAGCHTEPLFTDNSFRNNGMATNRFKDNGRQNITQLTADSLHFKVPTLRNTQVSFPYMHDGSIYGLPSVIDYYTDKINPASPIIDPLLQKKISLSEKEKKQLLYFLFSLTDSSFLKNKKFSPEQPIFIKH